MAVLMMEGERRIGFDRISKFDFVVGLIHDLYPRVMFYYGPIATGMSALIAYKLVISTTSWLAGITLPIFAGAILAFIGMASLFVWKVQIPTTFAYNNWQSYRNKPVAVEDLFKRLDEIDAKLGRLADEMRERGHDKTTS